MDKSWMKKSRSSRDYLQGVKDFLNFASVNASKDGTISCPCVKCVNSYILKTSVVHDHLVQFGISQGYDCWYNHGETMSATTFGNTSQTHVEDMQLDNDSIRVMLRDVFPLHTRSVDEIGDAEHVTEPSNGGPSGQQQTQVPNINAQKFYDLLKVAEQPFYEGCTNHSKLSAILHLFGVLFFFFFFLLFFGLGWLSLSSAWAWGVIICLISMLGCYLMLYEQIVPLTLVHNPMAHTMLFGEWRLSLSSVAALVWCLLLIGCDAVLKDVLDSILGRYLILV